MRIERESARPVGRRYQNAVIRCRTWSLRATKFGRALSGKSIIVLNAIAEGIDGDREEEPVRSGPNAPAAARGYQALLANG